LNVSLWSALERCRFINPESAVDDLIEINLGENCRCRAVRRGQNVDQKRRRFVTLAAKLDRAALVWWSPHIRAPAKTKTSRLRRRKPESNQWALRPPVRNAIDYAETADVGFDADQTGACEDLERKKN
jgi:hypothetical protein